MWRRRLILQPAVRAAPCKRPQAQKCPAPLLRPAQGARRAKRAPVDRAVTWAAKAALARRARRAAGGLAEPRRAPADRAGSRGMAARSTQALLGATVAPSTRATRRPPGH